MSLLDDVSIVVTPNGYKAGELYAVIPVPTEGAEEIVNGDFATETVWNFSGTTFSVGAVLFDNTNDNIFQSFSDTINTIYKLTITKTGLGTLQFRSGFLGDDAIRKDIPESGILYFTSTVNTNRVQIFGKDNVSATLNSVSLKEWTGADMDVTRATAATRVDENGLVNYAEVVSETEEVTNGDFATDSDWTKGTGVTISGGKANWTNTANNVGVTQSGILTSGKNYKVVFTVSNYSSGSVRLRFPAITERVMANGTYTYYINATATNLYIQGETNGDANVNFSIDNVSVKEILRDNVPRIDYTGGGCPHILAEPQRTNEVTYSEDFSSWSNDNSTDTPNSITAPDGTLTATKVTEDTATGRHGIWTNIGSQTGTEFSFSAYVKDNDRRYVSIVLSDTASWNSMVVFDLTTGTITKEYTKSGYTGTSSITAIGNGWYRISNTLTGLAFSGSTVYSRIYLQDTPTPANPPNNTYTGDGISSIYIWGAQLEAGSYPTSYIPTSGGTVTRNQDIFTRDGIGSLINSTEGVLFAEIAALADDNTNRCISLSDGTETNRVSIVLGTSNNHIRGMVLSGGTSFDFSTFSYNTLNNNKIAIKYKVNDFALWINGVEVGTDTSGNTPVGLNRLVFDLGGGTLNFFGKVKQLQVFKTALTESELIALTTI